MECVTCGSERTEKFVDAYGGRRVFCRNCWVSFPEDSMKSLDPRSKVYINVGALMGGVKHV